MIRANKCWFSIINKVKQKQKSKSINFPRMPSHQFNDFVGTSSYSQQLNNLTYYQQYLIESQSIERAFTGKLWAQAAPGFYHCAICNTRLFTFDKKINKQHYGYTSFFDCVENRVKVLQSQKASFDLANSLQNPFREQQLRRNKRCECGECGTHIGALVMDGPYPTLLRFIVNSQMLKFEDIKDFVDPTIRRREKRKQKVKMRVTYI